MILLDAMSLRDGETTLITVIREGKQETFTIDYSLPWDGRTRYVFQGEAFQKKEDSKLEVGGEEERQFYCDLKSAIEEKYGKEIADSAISGKSNLPVKDKWFYACHFLTLLEKERHFSKRFSE